MATRTHAWIIPIAALLALLAASCAMPEPIPFADSKFGGDLGGQTSIDSQNGKDGGPVAPLPPENGVGGLDRSRSDGPGFDGLRPDGSRDGGQLDGLKREGLPLDGPKKKQDGQKKPDGKSQLG